MEVGSSYSGLQAFDMVSKSVEMVNDLNKSIVQEDIKLDRKMVDVAVTVQVSQPASPETVHSIDTLA